jgi:hypothetical protein
MQPQPQPQPLAMVPPVAPPRRAPLLPLLQAWLWPLLKIWCWSCPMRCWRRLLCWLGQQQQP